MRRQLAGQRLEQLGVARLVLAAEVVNGVDQAPAQELRPRRDWRRRGRSRGCRRRHPGGQLLLAREARLRQGLVAAQRRFLEALGQRRFVQHRAAEELRLDRLALLARVAAPWRRR